MFTNIGGKIKALAKVICWIGIIASVIVAFLFFGGANTSYATSSSYPLYGLVCLIVGPLASWISSFLWYGFGELVENSSIIAQKLAATPTETPVAETETAEASQPSPAPEQPTQQNA